MAPVGYGFLLLIFTAALVGVVVGAIAGAVVWRLRCNLALGGLLTACVFPLVLVAEAYGSVSWLRAKLIWGAPAAALTFLICSIAAHWLGARTALRPMWIALAAGGLALGVGLLYLAWFKHQLLSAHGAWGPMLPTLAADMVLLVVLLLTRRPARSPQ
jgi:hypothetical protein